jgi:hypothetical protein
MHSRRRRSFIRIELKWRKLLSLLCNNTRKFLLISTSKDTLSNPIPLFNSSSDVPLSPFLFLSQLHSFFYSRGREESPSKDEDDDTLSQARAYGKIMVMIMIVVVRAMVTA